MQRHLRALTADKPECMLNVECDSVQAFAVAIAKRNTPDDPSVEQAMSGPEAEFWSRAMDEEMDNFETYKVFENVAEDRMHRCRTCDTAFAPWRTTACVEGKRVLAKAILLL